MSELLHTIQLICILVFLCQSTGERTYDIVFLNFNCTGNKEYISYVSCSILHSTAGNADIHMIKEIKKPFLSLKIDLIRQNGNDVSLFRSKGLDVCRSTKQRISQTILSLVKKTLIQVNAWKCPVPAGHHFTIRNLTIDTNFLPEYIPDDVFKFNFELSAENIKTVIYTLDVLGRLVNKKIQNRRKNFPK